MQPRTRVPLTSPIHPIGCLSTAGDLPHPPPCLALVRLTEKVSSLEQWRLTTDTDLKAIQDVVAQVKLLMSLSIGGGGLSLLTLILTIVTLVTR